MRGQKEKKRKDKGRECKRTEKTWGSMQSHIMSARRGRGTGEA